jgi:hypothetical protein
LKQPHLQYLTFLVFGSFSFSSYNFTFRLRLRLQSFTLARVLRQQADRGPLRSSSFCVAASSLPH